MNSQLADLLLPPENKSMAPYWLGAVLLTALLGLLAWRWQKRRRLQQAVTLALKEIHLLAQAQENSTPQESAIQLSKILCKGLGIKHLDQYQSSDAQAWQRFHTDLNTASYSAPEIKSNNSNSKVSNNRLIVEAKQWLLTHQVINDKQQAELKKYNGK